MLKSWLFIGTLLVSFSTFSIQSVAETLEVDISPLQHAWAKASYQTPPNAQEKAFEQLTSDATALANQYPNNAEVKIWQAIALSSQAKVKGGLGALSLVKKARDLLLEADAIKPNALQGSAYTSLGSLYYKVPSWPIGFGDKTKANNYLQKALQINPDGIDPNFFYADFLAEAGDYTLAIQHYKKAILAPARIGREDADAGRRIEVEAGLKMAEAKLKK